MGLEGIVSKRAGSLYRSGNGRHWLKCKNPDFVEGDPLPRDGSLAIARRLRTAVSCGKASSCPH
jgi:ATP-dependent DNA ligase